MTANPPRARRACLAHGTTVIAALLVASSSFAAEPLPTPLTPQQEQKSFRFADDELMIELVAAEPDVVSPVAIAWDADGRMFVAEMSDYPASPEKGRIKLLQDRDGNGHYEQVTVFADQLPFPNGTLPWTGGVLVTAAPDIWFLKDTDGDGVADERRRILTGFGQGNQQLRANGLFWGLDNWIYGANGRSEGEVRWVDATGEKERPVSIRGHDFRFRPDTREFQPIAGRSQFGLARDDWGNRFLSWNTIPIRHEVLPQRYLDRNPYLAATESVLDILEPGDSGRVYPLTAAPLTFNNESTSHFNALAGLTVFRGDALGEKYRGHVFVGESLRNLVHRRVLEVNGPTFLARRGEQGKEFLASSDPWFHAVNFATGPDGALYVVDFYRRFVEHPEYVQGRARHEMPWRTGAEHGRIWRVRRSGFGIARPKFNLTDASTGHLVSALEKANGWWRDTAQRLLLERRDGAAKPLLEKAARKSTKALTRLQALYTLDGLGRLTLGMAEDALKDSDPRVRESALRLSGDLLRRLPSQKQRNELEAALLSLKEDRDSRVRFQWALALGDLADQRKHAALARLANRDFTNHWHALAILSSLGDSPWLFLKQLVSLHETWLHRPTTNQVIFLDQVARLIGANHTDAELGECLALIHSLPDVEWPGVRRHETETVNSPASLSPAGEHPFTKFALLAGLAEGLARSGQPLHQLLGDAPAPNSHQIRALNGWLPEAAKAALRPELSVPIRLAALRIIVQARLDSAPPALLQLLRPDQPVEVQSAAVRGVGELVNPALAEIVFADWTQYATVTRRQLVASMLRSADGTAALVDALEKRAISFVELDASTRQALQKIQDTNLKKRVSELFQDLVATDRDAVIRAFQPALKTKGNQRPGAAIFAKLCLTCHRVGGQGARLGPDLSGISSRPSEALLIEILDPSRQVSPDFISYTLNTTTGKTLNGLIAAETATSVTIRRQGQPEETVLRSEINELRAEGKSLMPDGLEQGLTIQDLADLLEFLRRPEAAVLP